MQPSAVLRQGSPVEPEECPDVIGVDGVVIIIIDGAGVDFDELQVIEILYKRRGEQENRRKSDDGPEDEVFQSFLRMTQKMSTGAKMSICGLLKMPKP